MRRIELSIKQESRASMTEALEKRIAGLERKLEALMKELCPAAPLSDEEIYAEVDHLIQTLGPDKAAEEINRRNRLRRFA